jgi:hypothetical protein
MQNGWVKIYRQITENELWFSEPFTRGQAWIDLLILTNHKESVVFKRGIKVTIHRGEIGWSQDKLAKRWQWSRGKVKRFLNYLETIQQIKQQKSFTLSKIKIVNYEKYQEVAQQTDGRRTADSTADSTNNKNVKKIKEVLPNGSTVDPLNNELNILEKFMFSTKREIPRKRTWGSDKAQRINLLLDYAEYRWDLKKLDDSENKNRQWAFNLLRKYGAKNVMETIDWIPTNEFWSGRATKLNVLWYNWEAIQKEKNKVLINSKTVKLYE